MYFEDCIRKLYPGLNSKDYYLRDGTKSDYTFNQVKALAKALNRPPEDISEEIFQDLQKNHDISAELNGTTILINMKDEYLSREVNNLFSLLLKTKSFLLHLKRR